MVREDSNETAFLAGAHGCVLASNHAVAPTQLVPIVRQKPKDLVRVITLVRWGLIPSWAKDPSVAAGTINYSAFWTFLPTEGVRCDYGSERTLVLDPDIGRAPL